MSYTSINLDLNNITSHNELITHFNSGYTLRYGDSLTIYINLNTFNQLYPDYLLLISCFINNISSKGVNITTKFLDFKHDSNRTKYASRINFFKSIGFAYEENFNRSYSNGRFTEMSFFDKNNATDIFNSIMSVLIRNSVNENLLIGLDFCIWEIIDNTINHSESSFSYNGKGFVCAQFYPYRHEIRLIIADSGIGIHKSLTIHPNTKYANLSEEEALRKSIQRGITNSEGMGFGLWATAELIKNNNGRLIIHSGNYQLDTKSDDLVKKSPNWEGTYTFISINTLNKIDYSNVFNDVETRIDLLNEKKDEISNDNLDDLW
jgi:hypothetical protein